MGLLRTTGWGLLAFAGEAAAMERADTAIREAAEAVRPPAVPTQPAGPPEHNFKHAFEDVDREIRQLRDQYLRQVVYIDTELRQRAYAERSPTEARQQHALVKQREALQAYLDTADDVSAQIAMAPKFPAALHDHLDHEIRRKLAELGRMRRKIQSDEETTSAEAAEADR